MLTDDARLLDFWQKIERAETHLDALDHEVRVFLNREPCRVRIRHELQPGQELPPGFSRPIAGRFPPVGHRIWVAAVLREPPSRWSAVIGDCVHNLRSALDHLTWQLALLQSSNPSRSTQFPIFLDETKYQGSGQRQVAELTAAQRTCIESLQPYHGGDPSHPLWVLHELDRIDKHQRLHLTVNSLEASIVDFRGEHVGYEHLRTTHVGPVDDGTELLRVNAVPTGTGEPRVDVQADFAFGVAIDESPAAHEMAVPTLRRIWGHILGDVLPEMAKVFP